MKDLTDVTEAAYVKMMLLVRFQGGREKYLTSNKVTDVTLDRTAMTKEADVTNNYTKPEYEVDC